MFDSRTPIGLAYAHSLWFVLRLLHGTLTRLQYLDQAVTLYNPCYQILDLTDFHARRNCSLLNKLFNGISRKFPFSTSKITRLLSDNFSFIYLASWRCSKKSMICLLLILRLLPICTLARLPPFIRLYTCDLLIPITFAASIGE